MARLPDLVLDSKIYTEFRDSITFHSYPEIDEGGRRFYREEQWRSERILGQGGFGQVTLQRCVTKGAQQGTFRAVKLIQKPMDTPNYLNYNRELEAIAKFSHDRYKRWFVKSFGWFENSDSVFITMEHCRHGDLRQYLLDKHSIPADEVQQLIYQLLEGLDQMHKNDFAHRDVKPGNILIKAMPPEEEWWIVLADFGISKRADESNGLTTTVKGTTAFMAPELRGLLDAVKMRPLAEFKAADMWAIGEIAFRMLTGEATFQGPREVIAYCEGRRNFPVHRLPTSARADCYEFVSQIMRAFPNDRMTTTQSLQHRWMKSQHVRKGFATRHSESFRPMVLETLPNESYSARWSSLSDPDRSTQMAAMCRPALPSTLNSSGMKQARPQSTSASSAIIQCPRIDRDYFIPTKMMHVRTIKTYHGMVYSVAFSPDSIRLASGLSNHRVKIWDVDSAECLKTLRYPSAFMSRVTLRVLSVAFSPDSILLASGSMYGTIKLWDAVSGQFLQKLKGHSDRVNSLAFSPDSTQLASGSGDKTIRLWDVVSSRCLQTLTGHKGAIRSVAFSPDSTRLASGSDDQTTKLWDTKAGLCVQTLKGHSDPVCSVTFSPDSARLASGSVDRTIMLWDIFSSMSRETLIGHKGAIMSVVFSPVSKSRLVSGSTDGTIRLWDVGIGTGKCLQTLEGHRDTVYSVTFSPDSTRLASGSRDESIMLWDAIDGWANKA